MKKLKPGCRMGKLIVIEGLDGSGKATQTQLLHQSLLQQGINAQKVSFPNYESDSSALVRMYLNGDFGKNAGDVNAWAASSFYAVDRYASYHTSWRGFYEGGGTVLADRYTTSNAIHQCAKLPKQQWEEYISWLEDFEYTKLAIPAPSLVVYLDVEPEVSQSLLTQRYGGEDKKDIHEKDLEYLLLCREAAQWCAARLGWHTVKCTQNGAMRTKESILEDVKAAAAAIK